jgi:glucose/arabinose dehydrogenase
MISRHFLIGFGRSTFRGVAAIIVVTASVACAAAQSTAPPRPVHLDTITLPAGFTIELFASDVRNARSMARGDKGTIFVGTRSLGSVFAVRDENGDGTADRVHTIAEGLKMPNGVAFRDGALYVAEVHRILRYDAIEDNLEKPPSPVVVYDKFPTEEHHGWKFIAFGPDGLLYVPVGAPCNICDKRKEDPRFASITRMKPDGTGLEVFAHGIRNTVGFTWHPQTKALWFTDNGRDMLGDDIPPDELNVAPRAGMDFGYPYCHAGEIKDPEFGSRPCSDFTPPVRKLGPHVAALGVRFYDGAMFPAEYRGQLIIAEHGSWNRTTPLGYRLMRVKLQGDTVTSYEPFAQGWLQGGESWGRPVDVLVMPDGALLVSDDKAGVIYRITYRP